MQATILIIDDEAPIREALAGILTDEGYRPLAAASAEAGLELIANQPVNLVLLDIWMQGMDGLDALKLIRQQYQLPVIMISGHGTIETAVQATRLGAFDFIEKPLSYDKIILAISNGLRVARLERENSILRDRTGSATELTGTAPVMTALRQQIERVAPTDASVLIQGESGTGKELVAQAIHRQSRRAGKPMVEINCAAISEDLIESELFGHEKGAFTGAAASRQGKFDLADGGTLFLDEIGDMSLKTQAKVLRILQEQKFERVGGSRTISVDVRVLAATNKDLPQEIAAGAFRADLFYRLNVVPLAVPPLRERLSDIPLLVEAFLQLFARKGLGGKRLAPAALMVLQEHSWPGNVRELRNFIERMVIMCPDAEIGAEEVRLHLRPVLAGDASPTGQVGDYLHLSYREAKKQFEYGYLKARLTEQQGNVSQTAERIGLERSHLSKKLKELAIEP
jgi:two-component system nitrogen regulation response regulator NtrX